MLNTGSAPEPQSAKVSGEALETLRLSRLMATFQAPPRAKSNWEPAPRELTLMPDRSRLGAAWVPGLALLPATQPAVAPVWQSLK